jgi:hypothetical protein
MIAVRKTDVAKGMLLCVQKRVNGGSAAPLRLLCASCAAEHAARARLGRGFGPAGFGRHVSSPIPATSPHAHAPSRSGSSQGGWGTGAQLRAARAAPARRAARRFGAPPCAAPPGR